MKRFVSIFLVIFFYFPLSAQLHINEFSANNGYIDEDLENVDWIEVMNISDSVVDLSNYYLSDDLNELNQWQFPNELLEPMEMILVCASGKNRNYRTRHWESIILSNNQWRYFIGEEEPPENWNNLGFTDNWTGAPGGFGYGDSDDNTVISFPDGVVSIYFRKTFNIENIEDLTSLVLHADYDDAFVAYINGVEIMRSENISGFPPEYNTTADWDHEANLYWGGIPDQLLLDKIELNNILSPTENVLAIQVHNVSAFSSDMSSNFFLSAGINSDDYFYQTTPEWFDLDTTSTYHTNFKLSTNENVIISDEDSIIDSTLVDVNLSMGISKGRSPDGFGDWCYFDTPSPNMSNIDSWCYIGVTPSPDLLPSGWYDVGDSALSITLSNSLASTFYYTTNGDVPTSSAEIYEDPLLFEETTVLSVKSFGDENWLPSKLVDRTYIIGEDNHQLSVFSVFTDSMNLWDEDEGIYVFGSNESASYPHYGANFWEPWSKWSRLEYFDSERVKRAEEEFDLEIHGGWSRAEPQKSFRFDFKSSYTGHLEWPVIPQKNFIESFNNINLRNGGQHTYSDKIQDAVINRLVEETYADNMAYEPCILYLNGDYWGIYGIREKVDEHYIEDNYGYPDDEVDLLNSWQALAGSDTHFVSSYEEIMDMDVNDDQYYDFINSKFDINNFQDYFIIQTYIQNMDWMGIAWGLNNTKLWRPQTDDGRWRYVVYDTDGAWGYFGQWFTENYLNYARNTGTTHSNLFNDFLNNDQFQCEFINRYADLINTIFQPSFVGGIASQIQNQISDGMPDHIERWLYTESFDPSYYSNWSSTINSVEAWYSDIESMLYYNFQRIGAARENIIEEFDLDGEHEVMLDVFPSTSGTITISTITPSDYPWDGIYFNSCPIQIVANPEPGYIFDYWEFVDSTESFDEESFEMNITEDITIIAHFTECVDNTDLECDIFPCEIGTVYISEVHNLGTPEDYIEIYNSGDTDCSLVDFMLDDQQPFDDYIFTDTILANSYWLGYEDDINSFSSGLSNDGEIVYFGNPDGEVVELVIEAVQTVGDVFLSQSFNEQGIGCYTLPTPGFINNECLVEGCMNINALNYNELANFDNGTCEFSDIFPCELGTVYISEVHNFGEPEDYIEIYNSGDVDCLLSGFMLDDNQPFEDLVFGNIVITAGGYWLGYEDGINSFSFGISIDGEVIYFGDSQSFLEILLDPYQMTTDSLSLSQSFDEEGFGCYTLPTPGFINNDCLVEGCLDVNAENFNEFANYDDGTCEYATIIYGCIDNQACNYDSAATTDDSSCDYECIGCIDIEACNYELDNTIDDGSCTYALEGYDCYGDCLEDFDNDNICDLFDECIGFFDICGVCNGPGPLENFDCNGNCVAEIDCDNICGGNDFSCFSGCMDPIACNYDTNAVFDDGTCEYSSEYYDCNGNCLYDQDLDGVCDELEVLGCMVPYSCNYDPNATDNFGCDFVSCSGCVNIDACNYCSDCIIENNVDCVYPVTFLDCNGNCLNDNDNDNICDELDPCIGEYDECDICNGYGPLENFDCDGNCLNDQDFDGVCDELEVFGCTNSDAVNYNPEATEEDDSCIILGCTIPIACNYNPEATTFDSSCYYCFMDDCDTYSSDIYDCDGECLSDVDVDNICDQLDNCPEDYNPNQEDFNGDSIGDACDGINITEHSKEKILFKVIDFLGREINPEKNTGTFLFIFEDGSIEKKYLFLK